MNESLDPADAPDTVTDAVALLGRLGYTDDLAVVPSGLSSDDGVEPATSAVVDYVFRFEGTSDPGDEAIVLGVQCPTLGLKGVVVSAFGAAVDPEHESVLLALVDAMP